MMEHVNLLRVPVTSAMDEMRVPMMERLVLLGHQMASMS